MALHGREVDLAILDETLAAARGGRGRALFLTGEAGIGKSTLLAEARARAGDAVVLAGAAWESGGAPPYWPWLQVLRDAADRFGERVRELPGADRIASLVPAWGRAAAISDAPDPAAARFALLDGVTRALIALAAERPIVIVLDDLHAADVPTLDLLVLLARELPAAPIALVAAWREGELAVRADAAQRLARAARHATVQPLRRLTAEEVAHWVGADGARVFASSEGNPLFVEEMLRAKLGGAAHGLQAVLADHLALASEPARALLSAASVLGRELEPALLRAISDLDDDAIAAAMREAASVGIVEKREHGWAFRHVLLRDHLYDALPPSRRATLHRRTGEALERVDATRAAHHLLAGDDRAKAIATVRVAAERATAVYAFEDAVALLEAAVRAVEATSSASLDLIDLSIELARARHRAGQLDAAQADCVRAATLVRPLCDPERFASAALVYAYEIRTGRRDPTMIALLEEALAALPETDSPTRARVMARLAAAVVPAAHPDHHHVAQDLAIAAIAMARRLDDPDTTMFVLRFATHAQGFDMPIRDHILMVNEVIALSTKLGRTLETLEQRTWLVGAHLGLGDRAASDAAREHVEATLAPLTQPHYRWRTPVLRSIHAILRGEFIEAERWIATARAIAREQNIDRALFTSMFASLSLLAANRSPAYARSLVEHVLQMGRQIMSNGIGMMSFVLALAGEREEARAQLPAWTPPIVLSQFTAEAVLLLGERDRAQAMLEVLLRSAQTYPIAAGPSGGLVLRPVALALGELYMLLEQPGEAVPYLEQGLALAETIDAPPYVANGAAALSRALEARGAPGDRERARALADRAALIGAALEIDGLASHAVDPTPSREHDSSPGGRAVDPAPSRDRELSIRCAGGQAHVQWRGVARTLSAAKGFDYLALLIAAPGREIHVSELVGDDDRGDAGDVLDAKARASYRDRARELTEELEEARAHNDLGRIERLTAELDAITDELVAGTGLGGRARKAGSRVERARVNVQRRLKDAIRRIGAEDAALGRYLEATIHTGTFCSFVPVDS